MGQVGLTTRLRLRRLLGLEIPSAGWLPAARKTWCERSAERRTFVALGFKHPRFPGTGNQPASGEDDQRERRWQILAGAGCVAALQVLAEAGQRGLIRREADGSRASGT
jgi:hypothetical protein